MSKADIAYRFIKVGGILFLIAALAQLCVADLFGDEEPARQAVPAVASEVPSSGAFTWSSVGWLQEWVADDNDNTGNTGKFVNASAPKSLSRGKAKRQLCRITPEGTTLPGSFEYRLAAKGHMCTDGVVILWAHYNPKTSVAVWFDPRTNLTLRHSDGSGLEGQTFCPGAESANGSWAKIDADLPDGGPYFDRLDCVAQANQRLNVGPPLTYEDAEPFIGQFTSDLLLLVSEPECRSRYIVGCS